jgi:hypothetical protein
VYPSQAIIVIDYEFHSFCTQVGTQKPKSKSKQEQPSRAVKETAEYFAINQDDMYNNNSKGSRSSKRSCSQVITADAALNLTLCLLLPLRVQKMNPFTNTTTMTAFKILPFQKGSSRPPLIASLTLSNGKEP